MIQGTVFDTRLLALALVALLLAGTGIRATEEPEGTILFRWVDAEGKAHYTDNFNSIPAEFKASAVQGRFVVKADAARPQGRTNPGGQGRPPDAPRLSNRLELIEENYFEESGFLQIHGKVRNGLARPISYIKVKVSFYDKNDRFIRVESTFVDPIELQPGGIGTYKLTVRSQPDIAFYKSEMSFK